MTPPREIELKLQVPEQALARLTRSSLLREARTGTQRPAYLVSVYYDTDTQKLRKHGLTLRVRRIGPAPCADDQAGKWRKLHAHGPL